MNKKKKKNNNCPALFQNFMTCFDYEHPTIQGKLKVRATKNVKAFLFKATHNPRFKFSFALKPTKYYRNVNKHRL